MNNSLERLVAGIIATLRNDVIPNVSEAYARGQAIGVIDLLNNIAPRLEWARGPIADAVVERAAVLDQVRIMLPAAPKGTPSVAVQNGNVVSSADLLVERDRLDAEIGDLLAWIYSGDASGDVAGALSRLRQHMHDDMTLEMKMTRKPLFAEIAKGSGGES